MSAFTAARRRESTESLEPTKEYMGSCNARGVTAELFLVNVSAVNAAKYGRVESVWGFVFFIYYLLSLLGGHGRRLSELSVSREWEMEPFRLRLRERKKKQKQRMNTL